MNNRFIISLIVGSMIVIGAGFYFLNNGETPPNIEEPMNASSTIPPPFEFTGVNPRDNRSDMISQFILDINGSNTSEEILEALNKLTQNMNETTSQIPFQRDGADTIIGFYEELENLAQSEIDEGVDVETLKVTIIQRIEEYFEEMRPENPSVPPL